MKRPELLLLLALALAGCSGGPPAFRAHGTFPTVLQVPPADPGSRNRFNREQTTPADSVVKNAVIVRGHRTQNRTFADSVVIPDLLQQKARLLPLSVTERINALTLYGHAVYQSYFGRDFYRWGGDLNDLDDPQERGTRASCAFGLDCSGFAALPYDLAVEIGLLDPEDEAALFSSRGHAIAVSRGLSSDAGGRHGTGGNNGRLDTREMVTLGREVLSVERGEEPGSDRLRLLQPGDWVGRDGHIGIIVEIEREPYYLESGGSVVPRAGGNPVEAGEAIALFARGGRLTVRRSLPDRGQGR